MSDKMVLIPGELLSCQAADGLDVQDVLDNMTGADWRSSSYVPQTANEYRNQIIQELIEQAEADPSQTMFTALWLKSQMEGGE